VSSVSIRQGYAESCPSEPARPCLDREQRLIYVFRRDFRSADGVGVELLETSRENVRQKRARAPARSARLSARQVRSRQHNESVPVREEDPRLHQSRLRGSAQPAVRQGACDAHDQSPLIEIIGIVGDVRGVSLESRPRPSVYLPYWSVFVGQGSLTVRTAGDPGAIVPTLRAAIRQLDSEMTVPAFESIERIVARSVSTRRFQKNLVLLLAIAALALTSLGLYSEVSDTTRRRTHEIGNELRSAPSPATFGGRC
jgi:hypothetical protein